MLSCLKREKSSFVSADFLYSVLLLLSENLLCINGSVKRLEIQDAAMDIIVEGNSTIRCLREVCV